MVGVVGTGNNIGQMVDMADVDTFGNLNSAAYNTACNSLFAGCTAPGAHDGNTAMSVGGYTSAHRTGLTGMYMKGATGINEQIGLGDANFQGGLGSVVNTNVAHPILWAYNLDAVDFEVYEKAFQTPLAASNLVFQMTHGGGLGQGATARNIGGTCSVSGSASCTWAFTNARTSAPLCVGTPQFDIGSTNRFWITSNTTSCTVNFSASETGTMTFMVVGNPN